MEPLQLKDFTNEAGENGVSRFNSLGHFTASARMRKWIPTTVSPILRYDDTQSSTPSIELPVPAKLMSKSILPLNTAVKTALAKARANGFIRFEDLPEPWKINQYVVSGYRFHATIPECLISMIRLSNESFNIWSHISGGIFVAAIAFFYYPLTEQYRQSSTSDVIVAAVFLVSACLCMLCSVMWHTFKSIAEREAMHTFASVDMIGVTILLTASAMMTEYAAFYCDRPWQMFYISLTCAFGLNGIILPWVPKFRHPDAAWTRVIFFSCLGLTGVLPVIHIIMTRGWPSMLALYRPMGGVVSPIIGGAVIYASKFPEVFWPGRFDFLGSSHNLWHIAVLVGIIRGYFAMQNLYLEAFNRARDNVCM
ncbi:HlyIII-domain-containing protein [Glonium stellatum]|uniref:HlyIII-domain-containing protein n=1 Tax=Glonium stellatum TaxID=574774 RepID=A0A8E2F3X2_9PEZI|nr:HlyIII-domain-containing protein [Glonium stellatum]